MSDPAPCDVLVIGGGPAGSTAAALLAARGRDVVVLEKDRHPRFHIGESLLPLNLAIFDRLGIRDAVDAIGVFKPGAEFVSDKTGRSVNFRFADALDARYGHSYQVERAVFDKLLCDNAREKGARVHEGARVVEVALSETGRSRVVAETGDGQIAFAPRFLLDASGRDTFLAGRMKLLQTDKRNNTAAVFGHFRDVECRRGEQAGCISVHLAADGWFWMIPLPDDVMSVGFVGTQAAFRARGGISLHDFLFARIDASPSVRERMRGAALCAEVRGAGNYSYRARQGWGEGYMLIGDAFGFVDPVFSSGVLLAMRAAELGAGAADAWLDDAARGRALARQAERSMRRAMDRFGWLIYRINEPAMRGLFMAPRNYLRMRDAVLSVLAGNIRDSRVPDLPLTAFKAIYYLSAFGHRVAGRVRP